MRTPILKVGSFINKTIALLGVTLFTTPINPASEITVILRAMPDDEPASIVIVCLNVVLAPRLITRAATTW